MAFTVPATSSNSGNVAGTTGITVTKPTGLANDDILYAIIARDWNSGGDFACSGWTALAGQSTTPGRNFETTILRKVITDAGSEGADYTFTNSDSATRATAAVIAIVRGGDESTPEDATTTESAGTDDPTPDSPSITTNTADALVLAFCTLNDTTDAAVVYVAPSTYTLADSEVHEGDATSVSCGIAYATKASAGASGALTWQNTSGAAGSEWHTYTVAVKPGAGGTPSLPIPVAMRYYRNMRT